MYDHILVPLALDHGFSNTALAVAAKLLSPGGQITALHVYEMPTGTANAYLDEGMVEKAYADAQARLSARLEGVANVTGVLVKGHSGRTIIDYASDNGVECIVMGSHKPGLIDYLLGSTAARVVRHAPCAVHVLRDVT